MAKLFYNIANNAKTTITNNPLSNSGTSITLATGTGTKFPSEYFVATIWDDTTYPSNPGGDPNMEIVYCDSRSTDTVTVNSSGRGFGGTTGVQHNSGSSFAILDTKQFEDQMTTALTTGWIPVADTWTYSSVDDPTGVVTVPTNATTTYSVGMRIKFTNGGNTVYGIITAVAATSIKFLHELNTSSSLALNIMQNSAITNVYYSVQRVPYGFPMNPLSWTITSIDTTDRTTSTPVAGTWNNATSFVFPIGLWNYSYNVVLHGRTADAIDVVDCFSTLSTASNSESDVNWTHTADLFADAASAASNIRFHTPAYRSGVISLTAKTTYYLNYKTSRANVTVVGFKNGATEGAPCMQKAVCAYL